MSYCGEPYAFMLVTADGDTPDDPWGMFAFYEDYFAWSAVAKNVHAELLKRRAEYLAAIADPGANETAHRREGEIRRRLEAYEVEFDDLPGRAWYATFALDHEEHVTNAINVATEGACLMDLMDQVIEHYTDLTPQSPYRGRDGGTGRTIAILAGATVLVGATVGVAAWSAKKRIGTAMSGGAMKVLANKVTGSKRGTRSK